jgi:lysophospholipase L1-like esterase
MKDNRRSFIKKLSLVSATTLAVPQMLAAKDHKDEHNAPVSKTFLFQGDSITDGGRSYNQDWNHIFGQGYAYLITSRLNFDYPQRDYKFFNRGISGNKLSDLSARWQADTLDIKPDLLSILVGINDIQGVLLRGETASADDFGNAYDTLLDQTVKALPGIELVICEPFVLPVGMVKQKPDAWYAEVQKRQPILKHIAEKYNAVYVPLQDAFNKASEKAPPDHWIWDGIHPMPAGHELIAREWIKTVNKRFRIL